MTSKINLICCVILALFILAQARENAQSSGAACKEPNQANCYVGKNEGHYCSSKDQTVMQPRWYYDKGVCRKFAYKGCYGNRNRFCTKESCDRRCGGE